MIQCLPTAYCIIYSPYELLELIMKEEVNTIPTDAVYNVVHENIQFRNISMFIKV